MKILKYGNMEIWKDETFQSFHIIKATYVQWLMHVRVLGNARTCVG